jgi:hypothetical protein
MANSWLNHEAGSGQEGAKLSIRGQPAGTSGPTGYSDICEVQLGAYPEEGAAMIEFAIVFSVLCLFLFGIIAFGMVMAVKQTVSQAAAEGARAAVAANQNDARTVTRAQVASSASWLGAPNPCPEVDPTLPDFMAGQTVACQTTVGYCSGLAGPSCETVTVYYSWKNKPIIPALPFVSAALPDVISSTFVVQLAGPCLTAAGVPALCP